MPALDVWVTVVHGVVDTTARDFHRAEKVFAGVPLTFRRTRHTLSREQTRAILGSDGILTLTGGSDPDHALPDGMQDPKGLLTTEVWAAIRDWVDLGGLHVFYVPDFDVSLEGGLCLTAGDMYDPVIFVSQKANQSLLSKTKGLRGVLEHEIGHAFGLPHTYRTRTLMLGVLSSDASDAGTDLSQDELQLIANASLLSHASALGERK